MRNRAPSHMKPKYVCVCDFCGEEFMAVRAIRKICESEACHRARQAKQKRAQAERKRSET